MKTWTISEKEELLAPPQEGPSILTTVNADIYRIFRGNPDLANILLKEKICIDGRPLYYLARLVQPKLELIQGSSFIYDVARHSAISGIKILILGGSSVANQQAVTTLNEEYGCNIYGIAPDKINEDTFGKAIEIITKNNVGFVFICLGAPRQEWFSIELKARLPKSSKVLLIGAGGTVDFAANRLQRAPKVLQKLGLEGVYRLIKEPSKKRLMRLLTSLAGVFLFAYDLAFKKITIRA
jgi:N-acetylglucosaminyldiphosphoundecaprenol N-acetyl-beta-D-mannosaminyltransferase